MALSSNVSELLNRSPASVAEEQLFQLYNRIYPLMMIDFMHKADIIAAFQQVAATLQAILSAITGHTHLLIAVTPASPTSPGIVPAPPIVPPTIVPSGAVGMSLVIPGGTPQPTGEGVALLPSRQPIDGKPIAIPPLNPVDIL